MRNMRRAMCRSGSVAASRGLHSASYIGSSSLGGPGSRTTILRCRPTTVSMYCPGALPLAFGITSAPSITSAWRALFSGIDMRRAANRLYIAVRISASLRSPTPSAAAAASRVRSSSVGPSPPEKITMSARAIAIRAAPVRSSRLSPTMVLNATETPSSFSRAVR